MTRPIGEAIRVPEEILQATDEPIRIQRGSGKGLKERENAPRTAWLEEIIRANGWHAIPIESEQPKNKLRTERYNGFYLPDLGKLVLVCDAGAESAYVIHKVSGKNGALSYLAMSKNELRALGDHVVSVHRFEGQDTERWKRSLADAIIHGPPEKQYIERVYQKQPPAPEGYATGRALATELGIAQITLIRTAKRIGLITNEEELPLFADATGKPARHFSKETSDALRNFFSKRTERYPLVPSGWVTNFILERELHASQNTIRREAEKERQAHPDWFAHHRDRYNRVFEFYHPDLVAQIRTRLRPSK